MTTHIDAVIERQHIRCKKLDCSRRLKCHGCGREVRIVLDGEEWCQHCKDYQRPVPHGWSRWEAVPELNKGAVKKG